LPVARRLTPLVVAEVENYIIEHGRAKRSLCE
jgi:hypothetical protein